MKFRDFKKILKTEEYNIPDVLDKIKANLPEIKPRIVNQQRPISRLRFAAGFLSLMFMFLFIFTSISMPPTTNEISGPVQLNYFTSQAEITNTLKKFNKQKDQYINQSQQLYENYTMEDIKINRIYEANNQVAIQDKNRIYYLNNDGIVVYNTSGDLTTIYKEDLKFDDKTNVKTLYLVNNELIVIYNNKQFTHLIKYDVVSMNVVYTYTIAATYISSYVHRSKLYMVSILNNTVLPFIKANEQWKKKEPTDIGYLDNVMGESYTILTTINLNSNESFETIFLSFNKWDVAYFNGDDLYLINNHMNYKKNLDYGEYTTILKFRNVSSEGFVYHGSYTLKGSAQNSNSVYAHGNNFRIVLEVTHYNIKRSFLFFKKAIEVEQVINVVNLQSVNVDGRYILEVTSSYEISEDSREDGAISVLSSTFSPEQVVVESRGIDTKVTVLSFEDPSNIKPFTVHRNRTVYSNVHKFDESFGFSLRTRKTATGEFELRFFDLRFGNPLELKNLAIDLNYSSLLDDADYMVLEGIENPNALYVNSDMQNYYLGFSVNNNHNTNGTYTLIRINKTTKEVITEEFDTDYYINKIVSVDSKTIYGLSNYEIICYKLSEDNSYIVYDSLDIR